jgi:hypothetical protein
LHYSRQGIEGREISVEIVSRRMCALVKQCAKLLGDGIELPRNDEDIVERSAVPRIADCASFRAQRPNSQSP